MKPNQHSRWRVGEIAEATGLTVRALHHYEAIGLVMPTERTQSGHRLYGLPALERLYRVLTLRALGLPLDHIRTLVESSSPALRETLTEHLALISERAQQHHRLRERITAVLARLDDDQTDLSAQVVPMIQDVVPWQPPIERKISILVYMNLSDAYEYLVRVFRFVPGTITEHGDGSVVHAIVHAGFDEFWLHPESDRFALKSPRRLGAATATTAVLVDDVDEHHRHAVEAGATVQYEPLDQPYGFREYSAVDHEGHMWSFMRALE